MKKLLPILSILFCLPAWGTITLVQAPAAATNSSGTTCNNTITANGTGAQRLLILKIVHAPGVTLSSVSGGGTWTLCGANCRITSSSGTTEFAYKIAPTASVTTITSILSATNAFQACWVEEWSTDQTTFTVETITSANGLLDAACTTCAAPSITITGANDIVSGIASCDGTCAGTITGWSTQYTFGEGSTNKANITSAAFNWLQGSSTGLGSVSVAFYDTAGSGGSGGGGFGGTAGLGGKAGVGE